MKYQVAGAVSTSFTPSCGLVLRSEGNKIDRFSQISSTGMRIVRILASAVFPQVDQIEIYYHSGNALKMATDRTAKVDEITFSLLCLLLLSFCNFLGLKT